MTWRRVKQDLRHRFTLYQTAEKTFEKKGEILNLRKESLAAAHYETGRSKIAATRTGAAN